jgi:hypothetical protein
MSLLTELGIFSGDFLQLCRTYGAKNVCRVEATFVTIWEIAHGLSSLPTIACNQLGHAPSHGQIH